MQITDFELICLVQGDKLHDDVANTEGKVTLLVGANGNYEVEVSKEGYTSKTSTVTIACSAKLVWLS